MPEKDALRCVIGMRGHPIRQKYTKYADTDARGINICFFLYVLCAYTTTTTSKGGFSFAVMKQGRGVSSSPAPTDPYFLLPGAGEMTKKINRINVRAVTRAHPLKW